MKYVTVLAPNHGELERLLNNLAEAGWRVVAAFALPREGEPGTGVMGDFYAVLEHPEAKP